MPSGFIWLFLFGLGLGRVGVDKFSQHMKRGFHVNEVSARQLARVFGAGGQVENIDGLDWGYFVCVHDVEISGLQPRGAQRQPVLDPKYRRSRWRFRP